MNKVTGKPPQRTKVMTAVRALTLAIKLCRLELRRMSVDRNIGLQYAATYPEAVMAMKRSEELERVIITLERLQETL